MKWFPDHRGAPVTAETADCWRAPDGRHTWAPVGVTLKNGMTEMRCDHCGVTRWQPKAAEA